MGLLRLLCVSLFIKTVFTLTADQIMPMVFHTVTQQTELGCKVGDNFIQGEIKWCQLPEDGKSSTANKSIYMPLKTVCSLKIEQETCFECFRDGWSTAHCDVENRDKRSIAGIVAIGTLAISAFQAICSFFCNKHDTPPPPKPPKMSCPSIPTVYTASMGSDGAVVSWPEPSASDGDGNTIGVQSSGGESGSTFSKGHHTITFIATDGNGFQAFCFIRFEVRVLTCSYIPSPHNGRKDCQPQEVTYGGQCEFACNYGYDLIGSPLLNCLDTEMYDADPPTCERVRCSDPKRPSNANPFECPDGTSYQDTCSLTCETGYRLTLASYSMCRADGQWQQPFPVCQDDAAPVFENCPTSSITAYADRGMTTATVTWPDLSASDNSGQIVPTLEQGLPSGSLFTVGVHPIKFVARDSDGNEALCFFAVSVQVIRCSIPTFNDDNMDIDCDGFTYGSHCQVSCRFGLPLEGATNLSCERNNTLPPTGYWDQGSDLAPHCKETKCTKLVAPINGALACADWLSGSFCNMNCNSKFDIPRTVTSSPNFLCSWTDGTWSESSVPDCTERKHPRNMVLPSELYYYDGDCSSEGTQDQIKQNFMTYITSSNWKDQCLKDNDCKIENVNVICGATTKRKRSVHPWLRASRDRRSVPDGTAIITWKFVINFKVDETSSLEAARGTHDGALMKMAFSVENDMLAGKLDNIAPGFKLHSDSMFIDWTDFECKEGRIAKYASVSCHGCPTGTRYDSVRDDCVNCPIGTFQDIDSSLECKPCPTGTTTLSSGARNITYCKEICPAGTSSPTGLDPCGECGAGFYQPGAGSTSCIACPPETTSESGSTSVNSCHEYDILIEGPSQIKSAGLQSDIQDFTLILWLQVYKASTSGPILNFSHPSLGNQLTLILGDHLQMFIAGSQLDLPEVILSNKWNHVAVVWNQSNTEVSVFVGGTQIGSRILSSVSSSLLSTGTDMKLDLTATNSVQLHTLELVGEIYSSSQIYQLATSCTSPPDASIISLLDIQSTISNLELVVPSRCDAFDDCASSPCGYHTCHNLPDGFLCVCQDNYSGKTCSQLPNYCVKHDCLNGASCVNGNQANYTCSCTAGYRGARCEIEIINGNWADWGEWSDCSVTCGDGIKVRRRACDSPPPDDDGEPCIGLEIQTETCRQRSCSVCLPTDLTPKSHVNISCTEPGSNKLECHLSCNNGTVFLEEPMTYICEEGVWSPGIDMRPCTKVVSPRTMEVSGEVTYKNVNCESNWMDTVIQNIKNGIGCIHSSLCYYNVNRTPCIAGSRRRRSILSADVVVKVNMWVNFPESDLDVTSLADNNIVSDELKNITEALMYLEKSGSDLKNNVQLTVTDNNGVSTSPDSVNISGIVTCPSGAVSVSAICVVCPQGTYASGNICKKCSKGRYQDQAGQISCKACPTGYTTLHPGTISGDKCTVLI